MSTIQRTDPQLVTDTKVTPVPNYGRTASGSVNTSIWLECWEAGRQCVAVTIHPLEVS